MNIFSKFFSNFNKKKKDENLIPVHPDKIKILPSVISYCPSNISSEKVLKTFSILLDNNKDGDNSLFIAMAKIKESYEFLEKMHDCDYASAGWINNYTKALEALNENAETFAKEKKEADEKLLDLLNKLKDK